MDNQIILELHILEPSWYEHSVWYINMQYLCVV